MGHFRFQNNPSRTTTLCVLERIAVTISLMCNYDDTSVENVLSFSIQHVRLPKRAPPIKLRDLQFVKIQAIDSANVDRQYWNLSITQFRRIENEDTTSSAEPVSESRFGFMIAAIVP